MMAWVMLPVVPIAKMPIVSYSPSVKPHTARTPNTIMAVMAYARDASTRAEAKTPAAPIAI
jgi:hypothetical protein